MAIFRSKPSQARPSARGMTSRGGFLLVALVVPTLLMSGCGGGGGGAEGPVVQEAPVPPVLPGETEVLEAPYIPFTFEGVRDRAGTLEVVRLSMDSDDAARGKPSGSITGTLSIRDALSVNSETQVIDLAGTYSGNSLRFSNAGAGEAALAYSGQYVEPDTIALTPASGVEPAVTLVRADQSFRPALHDSSWSGTDATTGQPWKVHFEAEPPLNENSTQFLNGEGSIGGSPLTVKGHAVMRRIEIDITRGAQTIRRSGRMGPAGQTPPVFEATPAQAQTITFSDGSTLTRDVTAPPP